MHEGRDESTRNSLRGGENTGTRESTGNYITVVTHTELERMHKRMQKEIRQALKSAKKSNVR